MGPIDNALRRIGIEPAERALCGWAALCLLLIGATAFALLNASETLFLKRVGVTYLPWALLASSGLLVVTTGLASYALAGANRPRWLPRVLLGLALLLLPLWWLLRAWEVPVVFGAFVLVARQVLALGLKRVIISAKKGFHYIVDGIVYALPELWKLLSDDGCVFR